MRPPISTSVPTDSDVLDVALAYLDDFANELERSRGARQPKSINRWLSQVARTVRDVSGQLRDARPRDVDREESVIASRLERMAAGYFG